MLLDQQLCPAVAGRKCGAFMSPLFRDPHPTCARCRGKKCTSHVTCDICKDWSVAQWEAFLKKRSYSGCCKSRPSHCTATLPSLRLCFFGSWALFAFSTSFLPSFRRVWTCGEVGGHLPGWLSWCLLSSLSRPSVWGGGGGKSVSEVLGFWRRVWLRCFLPLGGWSGGALSGVNCARCSAPPSVDSSVSVEHDPRSRSRSWGPLPLSLFPGLPVTWQGLGKGDVVPARGLVGCLPGLASHALPTRPVRGLVDECALAEALHTPPLPPCGLKSRSSEHFQGCWVHSRSRSGHLRSWRMR